MVTLALALFSLVSILAVGVAKHNAQESARIARSRTYLWGQS